MLPYFILLICPMIMWMVSKKYRIVAGDQVLYETESGSTDVFMLIFLFLLAFRGLQCGNDTLQYFRLFKEYSSSRFAELINDYSQEIGYKILNKVIGLLFNDYQIFLIITSIICVCPLWYLYKKESENSLLTILLFLSVSPFVMYFSGIRQAMAMSIGILGWYAAKNKKLWRFILIVLLAMQFHTTAFALMVLYPLYHAKITKKWLFFVIPSIVVIYIFRDPIFNFLLNLLWKDYEIGAETGAITVLILLIVFAIYSYVMVNEKELDQDTVGLRNILLLSVVIQIFAMLHPLSMRMNYYFLIYIPILIPKIAKQCKKELAVIGKISVAVMSLYFLYYFIDTMMTDSDPLNIFPYIPFWENSLL